MKLHENLHPTKFQDDAIRKAVEALSLTYEVSTNSEETRAKRRKLSQSEGSTVSALMELIYETLGLPRSLEGGLIAIKGAILYVLSSYQYN